MLFLLCILFYRRDDPALAVRADRAEILPVRDTGHCKAVLLQQHGHGIQIIAVFRKFLVILLTGFMVINVNGNIHPSGGCVIAVGPAAGSILLLKGEGLPR